MTDTPADPPPGPPPPQRPCPTCGKPSEPRWRPFCSKRCADVDLGRWFTEAYRIPGPSDHDDTDEDMDAADPDTEKDPDAPRE